MAARSFTQQSRPSVVTAGEPSEGWPVQEVELKLQVTEDAAGAIEASPLLPGDPQSSELRAIYYDTPERDLAKAGFSLRIRSSGDRRVQTVKATGGASAGLFVRAEWEMPVDGSAPVLDHTTPIRAVLGDRCDAIAPAFEVHVERRTWMVHKGEGEIEVVLDRGRVIAGERDEPIREFELELKAGPPATLFELLREMDAVAPVRIGVLSKSERGYRLAKPPRTAIKAGTTALKAEMDAAAAFRQVAQSCLRQFRLNEASLLENGQPGALHQARVALRRLRSAFSLFAPLFAGDEQVGVLRDDLRELASILGEARNLDVLIERAAPGELLTRLHQARDEAYVRVETALNSPRARGLMLDMMEWLAVGPWAGEAETSDGRGEPVRDFAVSALDRARRKVKKRGHRLAKLDDEARHALRKEAKKLRYASEFFASLFEDKRGRRRYKRFVAALEELQDQLGALNDLATAPEEMRKLGIEDDAQAQALLGAETKHHLIAAAVEAHDALVDAKRFWR
jgi:inorganic triphosphatase YgiF